MTLGMATFAQSNKAVKYFQKARQSVVEEDYEDALEDLAKAIEESPGYLDALLMKADVHKKLGEDEKSLPLYEQALKYGAPYYVYLFYGQSLYNTGHYEKANEMLNLYITNPRATEKYVDEAELMMANGNFAMKATQNPKEYKPQNLGQKVNSRQMEYFPSISADGLTLVFTHRSLDGEATDEDFWVTTRDSVRAPWKKAEPLRGFLNTRLNEGAQALTSEGNLIYFAACERPEGYGSCDIYASFYEGNGIWGKPINVGDEVNSVLWESQPSISSDGRTLYFVRGKNSFGRNIDIYYATIGDDGRFAPAKKLEGKVNTERQETSPFIHFDDQSLYFASNGHPGMGDLDFFVSRRQPDGSWGEPQNLGYPINTKGQEFSLIVAPDGKTGYFASDNLQNGFGELDLYSFELPEESRAIEIAYVQGKVINQKTREPIAAKIEFSDLAQGKVVVEGQSGRDGHYFSVLPGNSDYALSIQKPGFLFYSKNFSLATQSAERAYVLNVELIPIEVGKKVKLENVFFDFDSFELDEKSFSELQTVQNFLKENPSVKISVEGHTDNEGTSAYNKSLSQNRAKSVYGYLVAAGVDASRLSYKGFGDSQPVAPNDTEEGRALNRRTEIKIVEF